MRGHLLSAATCRAVCACLVALAFLILPSEKVHAQSSELVSVQATARSLLDALRHNENELIDREVGGRSSGLGTTSVSAFSTGRLRSSDHDGLKIRDIVLLPGEPPGIKTFAYKTDEASAFANLVVALPGTVWGGQVKFSGFVGHNWLSLDVKSNEVKQLDSNQSGSAGSDSIIAGGTALWAMRNSYALATVVGMWGETRIVDTIDDCGLPGCVTHRYQFDTSGFIGTITAGHVFPLLVSSPEPHLDIRGSIGYTRHNSDRFLSFSGNEFKASFATWVATASATLFFNLAMTNGAALRPYIQAYVRQEFGYDNKLAFTENQGPSSLTAYDQSHTYPGLDVGATYAFQNMTIAGSLYYEASADDRTLGGRIGISWKLN
jgi:hypothetical protein